jgi:hypothetical protein
MFKYVGITAVVVVIGQLLGVLLGDLLSGLLGQPYRLGYSVSTRLQAEELHEYSYKYKTSSLTVGHL